MRAFLRAKESGSGPAVLHALPSKYNEEQLAAFAFRAADHLSAQMPHVVDRDHMAMITSMARDMVFMDARADKNAVSPKTGRSTNFGDISDMDPGSIEEQSDVDEFLPQLRALDEQWNNFKRDADARVLFSRFVKHREKQREILDGQHQRLVARMTELKRTER
jgi:hypothetical protein